MPLRTTYRGRCAIAREEAMTLRPYPDGQHLSVGIGHNDPNLTMDDPPLTVEQAWQLFLDDLKPREAAVAAMLKIAPQPHEFDALVSCYLNKGNAVRPVIDLLNAGKRMDAMAAFLQINRNAKGEFKPGLASRREREMRMFLYADYSDEPRGKPKLKLWRGQLVGQPVLIDFPPDT